MDKEKIVKLTAEHVKTVMENDSSGHDWWHAYRVWKMAVKIGKTEKKADLFVVQLGALLHDISDWKFNGGSMDKGADIAGAWLKKIGVDEETIGKVCDIVRNVSFRGAGVKDNMKSLEGKIVQDADRLDAIGAIGVARAFAYGGYKKRPMHRPGIKAQYHKTFEDYKNSNSTTINHFYERMLLLKDRMNTKEGRRIAAERDMRTREYLENFLKEWEEAS